MRGSLLPCFLLALWLSLPACSIERGGLGADPCPGPEGVATCDGSGEQLVTCADGEPSTDSCTLGCTPGARSCWSCTPGAGRCEADVVLTCESAGATEEPSATCAAGTCIDDGLGGAACGACLSGTSRCDAAGDAIIACGADGMEEAPVDCGADQHCEASGDGASASCVSDCVQGCDGDDRVTCDGGKVRETCLLGCDATTMECHVLRPSNVGDAVAMDLGTSALSIGMTAEEVLIFDTDTGRVDRYWPATGARMEVRAAVTDDVDAGIYHEQLDGPGTKTPSGATIPDLAVWVMDGLTVGTMGTIYFVGRRAAVLLVEGDVLVEGRINARAARLKDTDGSDLFVDGPAAGGGAVSESGRGYGGGREGRRGGDNRDSGGGGGSFGSPGGRGGEAESGTTAAPGPVYGNAELVPLYGGSAGGAGADDSNAAGGDAGGALQISVGGRLTVAADAIIDASGRGGFGAIGPYGGGGGGGSGGGLLLEAAVISIAGIVGVPGGGGGGGAALGSPNGGPGRPWDPPGELRGAPRRRRRRVWRPRWARLQRHRRQRGQRPGQV